MTTQNNADHGESKNARRSFWQRLSPFLDVIGAVLIFGSWILSHALSERAANRAKTHDSLITQVRQFRLYDDFAQRISSIQSDLVRTRNLVEQRVSGTSGDGPSATPETFNWTGLRPQQLRELQECVEALQQSARQSSAPETTTKALESASGRVREVSEAFAAARREFERLVEEQSRSASASDPGVAAKAEELRRHVEHLWQDYGAAKQEMLDAGDELLLAVAEESASASLLAKQCERLSWVLYVVGTLIILYGRAKSVLAEGKSGQDEDGPESSAKR
jgi:DNA repair exonuclease SbcCD ATPase subunit